MNEITITDILELEAHANSLLEKARKMRSILEGKQRVTKRNERDALSLARAEARFNKTMLRGRAKLEAKQKAGL